MKQTVDDYWNQFIWEKNLAKNLVYNEAFYFGSNETSAINLLKLVLAEKKLLLTPPN